MPTPAYYDPALPGPGPALPAPDRRARAWRVAVGAAALLTLMAGGTAALATTEAYSAQNVGITAPVVTPFASGPLVAAYPARAAATAVAVAGRPSSALSMAPSATAETAAAAKGLLPAQRYIASNQFKVRDGAEAKFEQRWATRKSRLAILPGFRFFTLLRRVKPLGNEQYTDDYNYVSLTLWQDKDAFAAWRQGDAFKEAHGGTDLMSFVKMVATSLLQTKGPPKVAFYDGLTPVTAPPQPTPTTDGWRSVVANGVDKLPAEVFVAMQRFPVKAGREAEFERLWSKDKYSLTSAEGFRGFWLSRADVPLEDGTNYVAMTVWADARTFFAWRDVHDPKGRDGPKEGQPLPPLVSAWPKQVYYEGVLVLESQAGI